MNTERRVIARVLLLAAALGGAAAGLVVLLPHRASSALPTQWWVVPLIAIAYGVAERTVFQFELRHEAVSFSLSEVPTAFALVYLAPGPAIAARVVGSLVVIAVRHRSHVYKLTFNAALFAFELAIAYHVLQRLHDHWPASSVALVVAIVPAAACATVIGALFVSMAIAFADGGLRRGLRHRLRIELRLSAWLAPVNASVAAATVAPTLASPWLVFVALVPLAEFWVAVHGYASLEQRYHDLDELHGFVRRVSRSLDLDEIADTAAREAAARLRTRRAAMVVFDSDGGCHQSRIGGVLPQLPVMPTDPTWQAVLAADGAQMLLPDDAQHTGLYWLGRLGPALAAPVRDGGQLLGLLVLADREGADPRFHPADVARLDTIADQVAPSLRRAMLHHRIEFEARHDALTGLPNRASFERLVDLAAEHDDPDGVHTAVLVMDLDRFKEVNDTLGHHAGDSVLVGFGHRLASVLGPGDHLGRLAGDEFAVLARRDQAGIEALAQALIDEARQPFTIDGLEVVVTMSVGVAVMTSARERGGVMLRRADIAMYTAKSRHTGYEMYREDIDRRTPARLAMLGDLRNALDRDALQVHLQPTLDLASGIIVGVEALARWAHDARGSVSPEDFVPVAEETGLIKQLTDAVLDQAIEHITRLRDYGHHLGLAVNLSTHDLLDELLPERVLRRLERHRFDPALLTLEITESSLLIDAPRARATIERLNHTGIRLSVDDFGTGYSSLSYLRHLPVAELKIDRSFVTNLLFEAQDEVIVRSIIDLGHNLGLQVVAEGVETDEAITRLRSFGCDVAQGYGICRPVPLEQFLAWVAATHHPTRHSDPLRPGYWIDGSGG